MLLSKKPGRCSPGNGSNTTPRIDEPSITVVSRDMVGLEFDLFSTADEGYYALHEFFRIQRLYDGLKAWAFY